MISNMSLEKSYCAEERLTVKEVASLMKKQNQSRSSYSRDPREEIRLKEIKNVGQFMPHSPGKVNQAKAIDETPKKNKPKRLISNHIPSSEKKKHHGHVKS